ncbi:MAG: S49 family peptidase [Pseudomonadota bacterium]
MKNMIPFLNRHPTVAVIRLSGAIGTGARALNDEGMAPVIEKAFAKGKPVAVALIINSPGGSPAQSSLIGSRIRRLADEKEIPVHAFVEDVAASGGYWLASAADDIWLDDSSVVGSIGVIAATFGAHEFLAKQGFERRVHTAGKSKSMLDPFRPEKKEDIERLEGILSQLHDTFIAQIKSRRGDKLTDEIDLFTGEFWLGQKAVNLGLADGLGHAVPKLKELYGEKVKLARYGRKRGLFQRFGAQIIDDAVGVIEERAAYARFGL